MEDIEVKIQPGTEKSQRAGLHSQYYETVRHLFEVATDMTPGNLIEAAEKEIMAGNPYIVPLLGYAVLKEEWNRKYGLEMALRTSDKKEQIPVSQEPVVQTPDIEFVDNTTRPISMNNPFLTVLLHDTEDTDTEKRNSLSKEEHYERAQMYFDMNFKEADIGMRIRFLDTLLGEGNPYVSIQDLQDEARRFVRRSRIQNSKVTASNQPIIDPAPDLKSILERVNDGFNEHLRHMPLAQRQVVSAALCLPLIAGIIYKSPDILYALGIVEKPAHISFTLPAAAEYSGGLFSQESHESNNGPNLEGESIKEYPVVLPVNQAIYPLKDIILEIGPKAEKVKLEVDGKPIHNEGSSESKYEKKLKLEAGSRLPE
jgi:hypothetical protein